jgi:hypothetical protein
MAFYVRDHSSPPHPPDTSAASPEVLVGRRAILEVMGVVFWRSLSPLSRAFDIVEKRVEHGR